MLLEDTDETCIRCGTDVTIESNVSMYPLELADTFDAQKEQSKNRTKIAVLIIVVLVLLAGMVAVVAVGINNGSLQLSSAKPKEETKVQEVTEEAETVVEEVVEDSDTAQENADEEIIEELIDDLEEQAADDEGSGRSVNDAKGYYYNIMECKDDAGNVVLNAVYPEDFDTADFSIGYDSYSTRYPFKMQFVASGEEGGVQFLYMSPSQLWYKNSETGKTRSDERDPKYYMSFYKYGGAKEYIENMLKASYPKAKLSCVNESEISATVSENISNLSSKKSKTLFKVDGDYAHVGEGTTYANMDAEYSALVYEYEITTTDKQMVFDKFYVPVISNNLYYANETYNDRGTVTEWYVLGFVVMEAGNEDYYEDYSEAFDMFVMNAIPTENFMKLNQLYSEEILESVKADRAVDPLTEEMLKEYTKQAKSSYKLDDFNEDVMKVLGSTGESIFRGDGTVLHAGKDIKIAFIDKAMGKLFISPEADEYPGDDYTELVGNGNDGEEDSAPEESTQE